MTLQEWSEKASISIHIHPLGTKYTHLQDIKVYFWELYHLSDYIVSSVCAGVVWLIPRTDPSFNQRNITVRIE